MKVAFRGGFASTLFWGGLVSKFHFQDTIGKRLFIVGIAILAAVLMFKFVIFPYLAEEWGCSPKDQWEAGASICAVRLWLTDMVAIATAVCGLLVAFCGFVIEVIARRTGNK